MHWVTETMLALATIPLAGFIYRYARHSPWWATWQGRILMTQKIAMLALVLFYLTNSLFDYPGEHIVKLALIAILVVLFWAMFIALIDAQTEQRPVKKSHGAGLVPRRDIEQTDPRKRS